MDVCRCEVIFFFGELESRERLHILAAKLETVALKGSECVHRGVPLNESRVHLGVANQKPGLPWD